MGGGGPVWEEEERSTIPRGGELLPPQEVKHEVPRERDDLVKGGSRGAEVDHPSEEGPPGWDHLGGKAEGAYEGEQFPLGAAGTVCPGGQGVVYVLELVGGEAGFEGGGVEEYAEVFEASSWSFPFVVGQWDPQGSAEGSEGLQVVRALL